jgi:hypothetical protein
MQISERIANEKGWSAPLLSAKLTSLEEIDGSVHVCIYPVASDATVSLTLPENPKTLTVKAHGLAPGITWRNKCDKSVWSESGHNFDCPRLFLSPGVWRNLRGARHTVA